MSRKIYVDCYSKYYRSALVEDGKLVELIMQERGEKAGVGDIYVGKVEKVLPSGIAFINIGEEKPVFLQINDVKERENAKHIKPARELAVQIIKEAFDEKCAVATTALSVVGKYCVITYDNGKSGVSKKIDDIEKRTLLKAVADKYTKDGISVVIRTNAYNADIDVISKEIEEGFVKLTSIIKKGNYAKAPLRIYKEITPLERAVRDLIDSDSEIVINDEKGYLLLSQGFKNIVLYDGKVPLFENFGIESQIEKLFNKKVWLKNGGYLVIDETEAMTIIDVNSGKATDTKNLFKINMEASEEIARQIRLRNLNGMIIIDFINVKNKAENDKLYQHMERLCNKDSVKVNIIGMTELSLLQLTRQKKRKPLSKYMFHTCPNCAGTGYIRNINYITTRIQGQIISLFESTIYNKIIISSNEDIINELRTTLKPIIDKYSSKVVILSKIKTSKFDYYEIEKHSF